METVRYSDMILYTGMQHLYSFNIVTPLFITFCKILEGAVHHQRVLLLCVPFYRPIARISPSLVLYRVPRSGPFTLTKKTTLSSTELHHSS